LIRRNGKRLAKPMKPHSPQRVIDAHNDETVNLETMTVEQVSSILKASRQSVSKARKQLGISKSLTKPHTDDGNNAKLLENWK